MRFTSVSVIPIILSTSLFLFPFVGPAQETNDPPIEDPAPIPDPVDPPTDDPIPGPDPSDPPTDDPTPIPGPTDDPFPGFTNIKIQYAAHFTCGSNLTATLRDLPGQYATSVNILNPKDSPGVLRKRVVLFSPSALEPGLVSDPIEDNLGPMEAVKVACDEIPSQFFSGVADLPPFFHGFLIIESGRKLNVTAVYTTGTTEAVQSMDVETVKGKLVRN